MMDLNAKLEDILHIITDISTEDPVVGAVLFEGFGISLNTLGQIAKNEDGLREEIELGSQIEMISDALNFNLEDIVIGIINNKNEDTINRDKEADEETLDFITADVDDYEEFLKKNTVKDDLEFLKNEV